MLVSGSNGSGFYWSFSSEKKAEKVTPEGRKRVEKRSESRYGGVKGDGSTNAGCRDLDDACVLLKELKVYQTLVARAEMVHATPTVVRNMQLR